MLLDGEDILKMTPDERAKAGLFLAMQYPVEVPGVSMTNFLRTAVTEVTGKAPAIRTWAKELSSAMKGNQDGSEIRFALRQRRVLRG